MLRTQTVFERALAGCAVFAGVLLSGNVHAQATTTQVCTPAGGIGTWRVVWSQRSTPSYGIVYQVQSRISPDGRTDWTLHHRPSEGILDMNGDGWADNHWNADVFRNGSAIDGYSMASILIPRVADGWGGWLNLTTLTSPGGECIFSPEPTNQVVSYKGVPGSPKLALTGDSLTNQSELCGLPANSPPGCPPSLSSRLREAGFRTFVRAGQGQGFSTWLSTIREQASTRPAVYVLAFGTNDAAYQARGATQDERNARNLITAASIQRSFAAVRSSTQGNPNACVVLVTASEKNPGLSGYTQQARNVNAYLRSLADGRTIVADWSRAANAHCGPDWVTDTSTCDWFNPDQLHVNYAGIAARNDVIVSAVNRCSP